MKTNWYVDNHFLTLSTRWSYQFDYDMLPRCGFETFGIGVPKISASDKPCFSYTAVVQYNLYCITLSPFIRKSASIRIKLDKRKKSQQ